MIKFIGFFVPFYNNTYDNKPYLNVKGMKYIYGKIEKSTIIWRVLYEEMGDSNADS
ncbi:hypothetical protein RST01_17200 [Rummeliibacillus stabekisii]|nr:hypothetical protein RST01_17200 [Rummeliibacillus stabekisii]